MADLIWLSVLALGAAALAEPATAAVRASHGEQNEEQQAVVPQKAGGRWPAKSPSLP
jgi:hypothetical protein